MSQGDMLRTVQAKSDQLNNVDLIEPKTITITRVNVNANNPDQPVSIFYEGDNGKPYKPCKTMRRALIFIWGDQSSEYVGRSLTLYRDPDVRFGKDATGGIRISHMSDIPDAATLTLPMAKGRFQTWVFKPIKSAPKPAPKPPAESPESDGDAKEPGGAYVLLGRGTDDLAAWESAFHGVIAKRRSVDALEALRERHAEHLQSLATTGSDAEKEAAWGIIDAIQKAKAEVK